MIGPGDDAFACLQGLAERIENLGREFRKLIQEKDAVMRERGFSGPGAQTAADQCRHRGGMVRHAIRPPIRQLSARKLAGDGVDHRDFEQFGGR